MASTRHDAIRAGSGARPGRPETGAAYRARRQLGERVEHPLAERHDAQRALLLPVALHGAVREHPPHVDGGVASVDVAPLEDLQLEKPHWRTPQAFDDGEALWEAVCEHELEGVVAKPRRSRYVSGERGWLKVKNRAYWRYEIEREGASKIRRARQFV
jgi:hypothetical protein